MNGAKFFLRLVLLITTAGLSSCASHDRRTGASTAFERPQTIALEKSAGRFGELTTKIRMEDGRELRCVLDTGSPKSLLPVSVEHSLGRCLGSGKFWSLDDIRPQPTRIYAAPKLYLGDTLLVTGTRVGTTEGPYAVLGMDCLSNYCIQLDFKAGTLRFLDPNEINPQELGKAFSLLASPYAMIEHAPFFGTDSAKLIVDTGCPVDGYRKVAPFREAVRKQSAKPVPIKADAKIPPGRFEFAQFPNCVWDSNTYTNMVLAKGRTELIGMRFLGRHLVTFNFPKGAMYLRQESVGPLN